jgi:hypothetical protein
MTLVVTTASARGITVVGDRAVTRRTESGDQVFEARKVWYSPAANAALAFWGNVNLPADESFEDWARRFVAGIRSRETVESICERLVAMLNPQLEHLGKSWSFLRRGIHVSGYDGDLPIIFHVHTGDPKAFHHALEVHRDYPDIHAGGRERYRHLLDKGALAQLRNGYYELFASLAKRAFESRTELSAILAAPVPSPTLAGQAAFDEALVRFAADILKSTDLTRSIGTKLDVLAFTAEGQVAL